MKQTSRLSVQNDSPLRSRTNTADANNHHPARTPSGKLTPLRASSKSPTFRNSEKLSPLKLSGTDSPARLQTPEIGRPGGKSRLHAATSKAQNSEDAPPEDIYSQAILKINQAKKEAAELESMKKEGTVKYGVRFIDTFHLSIIHKNNIF
jgi:hypothetical protein